MNLIKNDIKNSIAFHIRIFANQYNIISLHTLVPYNIISQIDIPL